MQPNFAMRIELLFYDMLIHILRKSSHAQNTLRHLTGLFQSGEWILVAGAVLASGLAGLISGYILFLLVGSVR